MDTNAIARAFAAFVRVCKRNPFTSVFTMLLLTWGAAMYIFAQIMIYNFVPAMGFVDRWFPSPRIEAQRFTDSIPRDKFTCAAVDALGRRIKADRVTYWTFSNGTTALNGVPFVFVGAHCAYKRPGISFDANDFQKLPNSISAETNSVVFPDSKSTACGSWTPDQIQSTYLRATLDQLGTDFMMTCGVRDASGNAIGKISAVWMDRTRAPTAEDTFPVIQAVGREIGEVNSISTPVEQLPEVVARHEDRAEAVKTRENAQTQ